MRNMSIDGSGIQHYPKTKMKSEYAAIFIQVPDLSQAADKEATMAIDILT